VNYRIHNIIIAVMPFDISCQNKNQKQVCINCIYRKFHKKAKRQIQWNEFAFIKKRYPNL